MSNFAFAQKIWPQLAEHLMPAESYLTTDPTASAARSRVVAEQLIKYLYRVMDIRPPYVDDFNARIHHNSFQQRAGGMVVDKFNLIRKHGNAAAHGARVEQAKAQASLRDLHHLLIWAGYHHSPHPELVPLDATFDPQVAKRRAVVPAETVQQFLTKVKANEERAQRRLEESEQERAKLEATIQTLREELAAKQQQQVPDTRDYGEAQTRVDLIDPLLEEAGWTADTLTREFEITGMPNTAEIGYVDYVLWAAGGKPLAVVEAKRSSRSLEVGKQQAKLYADALERRFGQRPVIFVTNGHDHQIWDDAGGYPPREIHGFYTRDELEYLIRRRGEARTLESIPVDAEIAGRHYQTEAIRAINEAFEERRRQALLVMATGTGKTRTVVALVDQLMKAGWARKVLFLADRTALVKQATTAFKQHLPSSAPHNLLQSKDVSGARVVVSTYQTIMGQLDVLDSQGKRKFGPGHFDLIVIDEAHRSVYAKYGFIFDYFDGLLVGLTATPKDEIDHNTYRLFNLEDGVPTDSYSLEEAVGGGYLVPFRQVPVTTKFQDSGIRYKDLSESEREEWDLADWGEEGPPDAVGVTDLGKYLFNEDTVDKVLKELMTQGIKVADGDRLGKTIIFAASQHHAEFIQERFDTNWPEHAGHLARVITHSVNYAQSLIEDFSDPEKAPHIAISVDMLDTGIDVPEVVNLVFFKKVHSKTKFWQMIGRGTRLCEDLFGPGKDKTEFLIFDFCRNLEFFMPDDGQDVPTREGSNQKSLTERLFELRLDLIRALDDTTPGAPLRHDAARLLKEFVDGMHRDNIIVRPHLRAVEKYSDEAAWQTIGREEAEELSVLGGLPSSVVDTDHKAKRFDLVAINGQLAVLNQDGATLEKVRVTVQGIAEELLRHTNIPAVQQHAELLENISDDGWWVDVTVEMLETVRRRIRGLAALLEDSKSRARVYTDFEDELISTDEVAVQLGAPGVNVERFKSKTQAFLREHLDHLALQRLRRNRALTAQDLEELEGLLVAAGSTEGELAWANEQPGGLGLFIRSLVGLEREAAIEAFGRFLTNTNYSVDQVRFINLIVDELTSNGVMEAARLFESPYTDRGRVDVLFPTGDVHVIVNTINKVRDNALTTAG